MENIFIEFLPPWVETNCQPAFYDKESGTVLQQTARMYDRVNMLIRMFNKLSKKTKETVEEYITKFNELREFCEDYFANLDVQEEINNKLDEMAQSGVLADIIAGYLQLRGVLAYDSIRDLKNATNIANGSYAQTYGFYTKGDGGGAKYIIRKITNDDVIDESTLFSIDSDTTNTLVAELIATSPLDAKSVGAKGDGTENDTVKLQHGIKYCEQHGLAFYIPAGTYRVSKLTLSQPIEFYGDGFNTVIKSVDNNDENAIIYVVDGAIRDSSIHDFKIDGNKSNVSSPVECFRMDYTDSSYSGDLYTTISHIKISNFPGDAFVIESSQNSGQFKELRVNNVVVNNGDGIGFNINKTSDSFFNLCTVGGARKYGFYIGPSGTNKLTNCKAFSCGYGDETTVEDGERIPDNAFAETSDAGPQTGKYYYTRTGEGVENNYYIYTQFTGNAFDSGTTYYELKTFYPKRYAGFYINSVESNVTGCESQDNYGDGFMLGSYCYDSVFSNVVCDNNGLLTVDGVDVSYASQNKTQLYYGFYINAWKVYIESASFTNHQYSTIGESQKGCAYIKSVGNVTVNGNASHQVNSTIIIQSIGNPMTISSTINNKEWVYNMPLDKYLILEPGFVYGDVANNFMVYKNGNVCFRLCVQKSDNTGILNGTTLIKIATLSQNITPTKRLIIPCYMTGNAGYTIDGEASCNFETWRFINVRYKDTSLNNSKQAVITGEIPLM